VATDVQLRSIYSAPPLPSQESRVGAQETLDFGILNQIPYRGSETSLGFNVADNEDDSGGFGDNGDDGFGDDGDGGLGDDGDGDFDSDAQMLRTPYNHA
jgi:hypothetical protein